jgi:hypothetical protein
MKPIDITFPINTDLLATINCPCCGKKDLIPTIRYSRSIRATHHTTENDLRCNNCKLYILASSSGPTYEILGYYLMTNKYCIYWSFFVGDTRIFNLVDRINPVENEKSPRIVNTKYHLPFPLTETQIETYMLLL